MSDIIGVQNRTYTESLPSPQTVKKTKGRQFLKIVILLMLLFLAGDLVYYLFIVPFNSTAKIQLSGLDTILEADLKKAAGLTGMEKWGKIDKDVLLHRITSYPVVAEARVVKKYPDKVLIDITERKPVGVLLATVGGRTVPMEIDKTGTVFKVASQKDPQTLPIISGLSFQTIRAGMKVHKRLVPLFKQLDILQKKNPALLSEISEMKIEQKKYGGFDLILYPVRTQVKVHTEGTLNEEKLQYMILALDVIRELDLNAKIEELDVRGGTASYRLRGETDE
ncbi:FtsQ-type POTRA domain-containing protein [Treponema vincentii]|jgi:cell division protein|uniref:POTRA domain protein, FtsQ-type n=1 Tax=Treponema vincentii ATCC 35580 TaxID=596324 RepID=C8PT64_9SPIR|nr:FtsQ-type POTRA domain-containing protein [Treponema vincentii]EEV19418.1 POTRA domain protein, FtsQ-type [Treponema vincentii ATCC 35580]UTC59455.1 FtsQ-type POTRA domain-containing protein [Treponema vincentii]